MTTEKKIYTLHQEHQEWLKKLSFYKDDLMVLQNRIEEVAANYTSKDFQAMVDHFLNQFLIQREQIQHLKHEIKNLETLIQNEVTKNATAVDHRTMPDHEEQRDKIKRFEEIFAELRSDLMNFLSKSL
jgi:transposase